MIHFAHIQIEQLAYVRAKGQGMTYVHEAVFKEHCGMVMDYHALTEKVEKNPQSKPFVTTNDSDGLVVFVSKKLTDFLQYTPKTGLCFKRFTYNICLSHTIRHLIPGQSFALGNCIFTTVNKKKRCFAKHNPLEPCALTQMQCLLPEDVLFAKVTQGGKIYVGDSLYIKETNSVHM